MNKQIFQQDLNTSNFNVVALLAIRNEALYLEKCLEHLYQQGINTCVIDNNSTDNSLDIAKSFINRGVIQIENLPFEGYFDLIKQLKIKEKLASEINANWFIHHDADEIREAPIIFANLYQAILAADKSGYDAINFDEFVFIPLDENERNEGKDFVKIMKYYYFFEPYPLRRVNAWKKNSSPVNLVDSGGHSVNFLGRKIFPENFILRHYIALSLRHLDSKYSQRVHHEEEVKLGWHSWRAKFSEYYLNLPTIQNLKFYAGDSKWDKTDIKTEHQFIKKIVQ
jgi:glycosyltransferase involved in cell wall biosynthesis